MAAKMVATPPKVDLPGAGKRSRAYVRAAVAEAVKAVTGKKPKNFGDASIAESQVNAVLCYLIRRAPELPEITSLQQRCKETGCPIGRGHPPDGTFTVAQITEALMEWQDREKSAAGAQEVRVLNRRDHFFELAHHGQTRAAVVKKMVGHAKCFFAINCLLAPLAIATITLALLEQTTLDGAFPEAVGIAVREAPLHECHHSGCSHAHIPLAPHVPGERERARGLHPGRCLRLHPPARRSQA